MCTLQGRTLLERCLESLEWAGISKEDIGIVTGYRSDMFDVPGVTYFHSPDWERTNMFWSLTMAREWLKREPCAVCYSDVVFSSAAFRALAESAEPLAITYYTGYWELWSRRMEDPLEDLETFRLAPEGHLLEIGKKPRSREEIQGQFMGLLRFTPESWEWVEKTIQEPMAKSVEKLDMTTLLQELLQRNYTVQAIPTDDLWLECDSQRDIEVYERDFAKELSL